MTLQESMKNLFPTILAGDKNALLNLFVDGAADVNLPSFNHVTNNTIFGMLMGKISKWLTKKKAVVTFVDWTENENACVAEYEMSYQFHDKERECYLTYRTPIALVCDLEGGKIKALRAYFGTVYIVGKEIVRPALWNEKPSLTEELPTPVKEFYTALGRKDGAGAASCFAEDAVVYNHITKTAYEGMEAIMGFYQGGSYDGVQLGNAVCDPTHCCVEATAIWRGPDIVTPQAQVMVFCLESGKIKALRIYNETVLDFKMWHTIY